MSKGTKNRNVRAADDLWLPAKEKAESEGTTLSEVIREFLTDYVDDENTRHASAAN